MTDTHSQSGDRRTVIHVDSDPVARQSLAERVESTAGVELESVAEAEAALHRLDAVDCVVADVELGTEAVEDLLESAEDVPAILYTERDPTEIPDELLSATDSLVQRKTDQHREFLLRKIRGLTPEQAPTQQRRRTDAESLASERTDSIATFLVDDDGTVVWASRPFEDVFPGADAPPSAGLYDRLAAVLADQPAAVGALLELPETDRIREGELLPISLDTGGRRDVVHCSYPLPDRADAARLELFDDLTVARERKQRLTLFETLVMGAQDGLYTLDANGTIDFCNPAMADQLGYDREEILGMHASEVMAEGELEYGQRVVQELIDDPERESVVYDMVFVTRSGERRDVSLHVQLLPSADDTYAGLVGVMRDVTERKERKRELERFETIIQALGDPVYAVDDEGHIIYVNEAFEAQTGHEASEVIGEHGSLVLTEESAQAIDECIHRLLDSDRSTETVELEVVRADGEHFPAEVHTALLPTDDGSYSGSAGVVRDITERKRREKRLEEFTSVVAHDLRNPLTVGKGNLDLYRQTGEQRRLEKVAGALDEMEQLIGDLLELARHGDVIGDTEQVALEATARDAWQQLQSERATLDCRNLDTVRADRARLRQAFENLFRNAVEHGGPTATVTVEGTDDGFAVEDDGPGIPPDRRESVLQRGYTTADEGTGFGLAIVTEIVEAHGWTIRVTEGSDGGARFEITGTE